MLYKYIEQHRITVGNDEMGCTAMCLLITLSKKINMPKPSVRERGSLGKSLPCSNVYLHVMNPPVARHHSKLEQLTAPAFLLLILFKVSF